MRELGVPHLVVAFDAKVEEICRRMSIAFHTDDEGTDERYSYTRAIPLLHRPLPIQLQCWHSNHLLVH